MSVNPLSDSSLREAGLVLQGVLSVASTGVLLPETAHSFTQLLVFGHAGRKFWDRFNVEAISSGDPLDDRSRKLVKDFLKRIDCQNHLFLYPTALEPPAPEIVAADINIDLRSIGRELGWHHDSPLGIGIHARFGTWFAYRAVVATRTEFDLTQVVDEVSPCLSCADKPCVSHCPAGAVVSEGSTFKLDSCLAERQRIGTGCSLTCQSRLSCPVGDEYRYSEEQMNYHYGHSLEMIKVFSAAGD
jgi:epoxyqueuosine reductase